MNIRERCSIAFQACFIAGQIGFHFCRGIISGFFQAVRSLEELLALLEGQDPDRAWGCGGGEIYRLLLPWCRTCHITRVYEAPESDAFFPDLDRLPQWRLARSEAALAHGDTAYQFLVYQAEGEGLPCRS